MPAIKRRTYNIRRIRRDYSYDVAELTELFDIHHNTIGHWRSGGLRAIDDRRPPLFPRIPQVTDPSDAVSV